MADIKTKKRSPVKTLDKILNNSTKIKSKVIATNDNIKNVNNPENENQIEYATNRVINTTNLVINKNINEFNKYGKKAFKETIQNIDTGKERIKAFKNKVAKNKEKEVIKNNFNNVKSSIKTKNILTNKKWNNTINSKMIKSSKNIAEQTEKNATLVAKVSKKATQRIKATAEASIKATKTTIQAFIKAIKLMISAMKALTMFLIAGGWVMVLIIVVICMIGFLTTSIFGIFFSNEYESNSKSMIQVVNELNSEFINKITSIQQENPYDEFDIQGSRADWKEILAVYVAKYSNGNYQTEMMSLDEDKINEIRKVFWDMNEITFTKDVTTEEKIIIHLTWTEHKTITHTKLHIKITQKSAEEMANIYLFNNLQREQLNELLKDDYISMWTNVIYGSNGSFDIVAVAQSQVGNVGGQPYWSWYGFESRVEWCATFVSWCANECGYIENGIIPKFAGCESEGVAWFKACSLWQEAGYSPKPGDIIFFDWADSHDGHADHVGIVKKVENGRVYTIEGNSNDMCREKNYDINSSEIRGYGTPMY